MVDVDLCPRTIRISLPQLQAVRVETPSQLLIKSSVLRLVTAPVPRSIRAMVPALTVDQTVLPTAETELVVLCRGPEGSAGTPGTPGADGNGNDIIDLTTIFENGLI